MRVQRLKRYRYRMSSVTLLRYEGFKFARPHWPRYLISPESPPIFLRSPCRSRDQFSLYCIPLCSCPFYSSFCRSRPRSMVCHMYLFPGFCLDMIIAVSSSRYDSDYSRMDANSTSCFLSNRPRISIHLNLVYHVSPLGRHTHN